MHAVRSASRRLGRIGMVVGIDGVARVAAQAGLIVTARFVGPTEFGLLVVALTIFGLASTVVDAGLAQSGLQQFTLVDDAAGRFRRRVGVQRLRFGAVAAVIGVAAVLVFEGVDGGIPTIVLLAALPLWAITTNQAYEFRASGRVVASSVLGAVAVLSYNFAPLLPLVAGYQTAAAAATASFVAYVVLAAFGVRRQVFVAPDSSFGAEVRRSSPFLVNGIALLVYTRCDRLVIAALAGVAISGQYAAASTVVLGAVLPGASIAVAVFPSVMRRRRESTLSARPVLGLSVALVALGAVASMALFLLRDPVIGLLYGNEFSDAPLILAGMAFMIPFAITNPFLSSVLVACEAQKTDAAISWTCVLTGLLVLPVVAITGSLVLLGLVPVLLEATRTALLMGALRRPLRGATRAPAGT